MILIGKNNHGKSNILHGILYFFGKISLQDTDFFQNTDRLFIEISFCELSLSERKKFSSFLNHNNEMVLRKRATRDGKQEYLVEREGVGFIPIHIDIQDFSDIFFISSSLHSKNSSVFDLLLTSTILQMKKKYVHGFQKRLQVFQECLNHEMREWGTRIEIDLLEENDIGKPSVGIEIWVDDALISSIQTKGHGLQRALLFALIEVITEFSEFGEDDTVLLFEEPELYLHPQAQHELYLALKYFSHNNIQVFLSTHSSYFIDLTCYKSICIVHRPNLERGTTVQQIAHDPFNIEAERKNFNMAYWINPDRGELFFAKKVILVEGPTEKVIFPKLAKKLHISHYEYTLIDCAGKSNMPLYISLLNAFHIPYVAVYDLDHQKYRNKKGKLSASRHSGFIEGKINPSLGESVVLVNDIEEELGIHDHGKKNKPFFALQYIANEHFHIPKHLEKKLKRIFSEKKR